MSTLHVEICVIDDVKPHPTADRLSLAVVKGFQIVIKKDEYKAGDIAIFIPPDACVPTTLSDKYNFTQYLKSGGRVKPTNLRSEPSHGILIPNEGNWSIGTDVAAHYGITKYVQPIRTMCAGGSGTFAEQDIEHPLFCKYTELENLRHYPNVIADGEIVSVTEKIHGCVRHDSTVLTASGNEVSISSIQPGTKVVSFDENTRQFVIAEVNGVIRQKRTEQLDWYELEFDNQKKLICTGDHPVLTKNRGWVRADAISEEDEVVGQDDYPMSVDADKELLLGTFSILATLRGEARERWILGPNYNNLLPEERSALLERVNGNEQEFWKTLVEKASGVSVEVVRQFVERYPRAQRILVTNGCMKLKDEDGNLLCQVQCGEDGTNETYELNRNGMLVEMEK